MSDLRPLARLYLAGVAATAVGLTILGLVHGDAPDAHRAALACVFAGAMAAASLYSFEYAFRARISLDVSVTVASALPFEPGLAMLVVGSGSLVGDAIGRRPADEAAFNGAQMALQTGVGASLLAWGGWSPASPQYAAPSLVVLTAAVATLMYLVNTVAVAAMIGLQTGRPILAMWRQTAGFDPVERVTQAAIGLLAATVASVAPWMLPVLLIPTLPVYRSNQRQVQLRTQTLGAVEALADAVDVRDP